MILKNKAALITGAGRGLGRAIACRFAQNGCHVIVTDVNAQAAAETANKINMEDGSAEAEWMDVSDQTSIIKVFQNQSKLDILVNNAAAFDSAPLEGVETEQFDKMIDVCLKSAFYCSKYAMPLLKHAGSGRIINISSINAYCVSPWESAYSAAKGGMLSLTRQLAVEYAPCGIRANSLSPGFILTDRTAPSLEDELELEMTKECYPGAKLGTEEDVAGVALFLASDDASFINGVDIPIDGGMSVQAIGAVIKPSLRKRWKSGLMRLLED